MGIKLFGNPNDFEKVSNPSEPLEITADDFCPDAPECFDIDSFFCKDCLCYEVCLNNDINKYF